MKNQAYLPLSFGSVQSMVPSILVAMMAFSLAAYGMAFVAAIGSGPQLTQPAVTASAVPSAPLCFDHSREWIAAHGAPQGCPINATAYKPAAAFRVHH